MRRGVGAKTAAKMGWRRSAQRGLLYRRTEICHYACPTPRPLYYMPDPFMPDPFTIIGCGVTINENSFSHMV